MFATWDKLRAFNVHGMWGFCGFRVIGFRVGAEGFRISWRKAGAWKLFSSVWGASLPPHSGSPGHGDTNLVGEFLLAGAGARRRVGTWLCQCAFPEAPCAQIRLMI